METQNFSQSQKEKGFLYGLLKMLPLINIAASIIIAIGLFAVATRDAQTVQASEINRNINEQKAVRDLMIERKTERDKQIEELKRIMLTKEIFDAYYQNLKDEQLRQRQMLEKIIENQNR